MNKTIPDITQLTEHMALTDLECSSCGNDIIVGDMLYVDDAKSNEFHKVEIYCDRCVSA